RRAGRISDANAHVNHSVLTEHNVRRITALNGGENIARVDECASVPSPACQRYCPCVITSARGSTGRLVVRKVDQLVLGEPRMQRDIHETGQALRLYLRQAGDGIWVEHAVADNPQTSGTFSYENAAIRKKCHTPRLIESLDHGQTDLMLNRRIKNDRSVSKRRRGPVDRWRRGRNSLLRSAGEASGNEYERNCKRRDQIMQFHGMLLFRRIIGLIMVRGAWGLSPWPSDPIRQRSRNFGSVMKTRVFVFAAAFILIA